MHPENLELGLVLIMSTVKSKHLLYCYVWLFYFCLFVSVCLISLSDGLVVVGVHSAKFPNEKVRDFIVYYHFYL